MFCTNSQLRQAGDFSQFSNSFLETNVRGTFVFECNLTTVCFNNGSERREVGTGQMSTKRDTTSMIHPRKKYIGKPVEFFFTMIST